MSTRCGRISEMCRLFKRYEGNEKTKISFSVSAGRNIRVYFVFDFLGY